MEDKNKSNNNYNISIPRGEVDTVETVDTLPSWLISNAQHIIKQKDGVLFWALQMYANELNAIFEKYNIIIPKEAQLDIYNAKKNTETTLNVYYPKK